MRTSFLGSILSPRVPLLLGTLAALALSCAKKDARGPAVETAAVVRKTLTVSASASGAIEPIRIVEVKSRASGEVLEMPVETGMVVEKGALLAQIDRRDAETAVEQAEADLEAAEAHVSVTKTARERSDALFAEGIETAEAHDSAVYEYANAQAALVKVRATLQNARERLGDTTVRAPSGGTILSKNVEVGHIIASAVSQVSGGTALLTMADLGRVQVRALVDEADIGILAPGQRATVEVEAHTGRHFVGTVVKIEPQAVLEQNVTLFPVLIELANEEGLLKPGMNSDIEILVTEKENVLVVPRDVLRGAREAPVIARYLGATGGPEAAAGPGANGMANGGGRRGGAAAAAEERPAGGRREWAAGSGASGAAGAADSGGGADARRNGTVAFVRAAGGGFEWRDVTTGLENWREAEVLSGLAEGDEVAIPPSGQFLSGQAQMRDRMRQSTGLPGMQRREPR